MLEPLPPNAPPIPELLGLWTRTTSINNRLTRAIKITNNEVILF
jgi:hypothetical protein